MPRSPLFPVVVRGCPRYLARIWHVCLMPRQSLAKRARSTRTWWLPVEPVQRSSSCRPGQLAAGIAVPAVGVIDPCSQGFQEPGEVLVFPRVALPGLAAAQETDEGCKVFSAADLVRGSTHARHRTWHANCPGTARNTSSCPTATPEGNAYGRGALTWGFTAGGRGSTVAVGRRWSASADQRRPRDGPAIGAIGSGDRPTPHLVAAEHGCRP